MTDEKKFEVHAEITVRLTQQDVDDIMVSALEGASATGPTAQRLLAATLASTPADRFLAAESSRFMLMSRLMRRTPNGTSWTWRSSHRASASGWRTAATATALSAMAKLTPARSTAKWQTSSSSTPCLAK